MKKETRKLSWIGLFAAFIAALIMITKGVSSLWFIIPTVIYVVAAIGLFVFRTSRPAENATDAEKATINETRKREKWNAITAVVMTAIYAIRFYSWMLWVKIAFGIVLLVIFFIWMVKRFSIKLSVWWTVYAASVMAAFIMLARIHVAWWLLILAPFFILSVVFLFINTKKRNIMIIATLLPILSVFNYIIGIKWLAICWNFIFPFGIAAIIILSVTNRKRFWLWAGTVLLVIALVLIRFWCVPLPVKVVLPTPESTTTQPTDTEPTETTDFVIPPLVTPTPDVTPNETPTVTPDVTPTVTPDNTDVHNQCYVKVEPTCTENGEKIHFCECGEYIEVLPKLGHSYVETVVKPTVTTEGYTEHKCKICGDSYKDNYTEKLPKPHEHSYTTKVVEATCTTKGYTKYTCSCGDTYKANEVAAKGHSYVETVVKPTVTTEGYTEHKCKVCGNSYKDNYTEKLHEHNYDQVTVLKPTVNHQGYTQHTCSCGDFYRDNYTNVNIAVSTDYMVKGDTVIVTLTNAEASDVVIKYVHPDTAEWVTGGATLKAIGNNQYRLVVDETMWKIGPDLAIGLKGSNEYLVVTLEPWFD